MFAGEVRIRSIRSEFFCAIFSGFEKRSNVCALSKHIGARAPVVDELSMQRGNSYRTWRIPVFLRFHRVPMWLQPTSLMHWNRSTLGTVVIVASNENERLVSWSLPSTVAFPPYFFAILPENAVTRVPLSLFNAHWFWVEFSHRLSFFLPNCRNVSPIDLITRVRLPFHFLSV